jgi:hypothetical protein
VPLTAFVVEMSHSAENRRSSGVRWDAILQRHSPLEKDASVSLALGHFTSEPYPDKVEVAAAVWADGTTFGRPDLLKRILTNRANQANALDRLISIMQKGLQEDWRREQYQIVIEREPEWVSIQARGLVSSIKANANFDSQIRVRQTIIQLLLDLSVKDRDALRQSKPDISAPKNPA